MKLIDLLEVCTDNTHVRVLNLEEQEVAEYDGKDSIDPKYNDREVRSVRTDLSTERMMYGTYLQAWLVITIA